MTLCVPFGVMSGALDTTQVEAEEIEPRVIGSAWDPNSGLGAPLGRLEKLPGIPVLTTGSEPL